MKTYLAKEVADILGLSKITLYNLEKRGVVTPNRSLAGYRLYTDEDIEKIKEHYANKDKK